MRVWLADAALRPDANLLLPDEWERLLRLVFNYEKPQAEAAARRITQARTQLSAQRGLKGFGSMHELMVTAGLDRDTVYGTGGDSPALAQLLSLGTGQKRLEANLAPLPLVQAMADAPAAFDCRVAETLAAWRGAPAADIEALEQILLRVSEMVCALPQLREMDINPIIVDAAGAVAVDARVVVDGTQPTRGGLGNPYNHLSILPYPARYEQVWPLRGGGEYTVRPIRPDDAQMLQDLVQRLSPESRYFRFVSSMEELPPTMLARFTLIDYDREMALVAVHKQRHAGADGEITETERILGVSRYITNPDQSSCEFALVVADDYAGKGLGARLKIGRASCRERVSSPV